MSKAKKTWIKFVELENDGRITKRWSVETIEDSEHLGIIAWFGRWRGYAFFPPVNRFTTFEQQCLRDIANFIEQENKSHREKRKKEKAGE